MLKIYAAPRIRRDTAWLRAQPHGRDLTRDEWVAIADVCSENRWFRSSTSRIKASRAVARDGRVRRPSVRGVASSSSARRATPRTWVCGRRARRRDHRRAGTPAPRMRHFAVKPRGSRHVQQPLRHGARIAATVINDPVLFERWKEMGDGRAHHDRARHAVRRAVLRNRTRTGPSSRQIECFPSPA